MHLAQLNVAKPKYTNDDARFAEFLTVFCFNSEVLLCNLLEKDKNMTDEPDNLVLRYLRNMDVKLDRTLEDLHDIKVCVTSIEESISGVNRRLDRIEERVDKVERRLEMTEA